MKISAIVRADNGGLGTLSRTFADFLPGGFYRTVSIARHEGENYRERFANNREAHVNGVSHADVQWLCDGADILASFETFYGEAIAIWAKACGVKTVLFPNYECTPLDGSGLEYSDLAVCSSVSNLVEMRDNTPGLRKAIKTFLPTPFDTERIAFKQRDRAETFLVHQGHGGLGERNGTQMVLDAWQFVKGPARLLVKRQPSAAELRVPNDNRISVIERDVPNYWNLWDGAGDVFLHPHRWAGASLPIEEACCAGLPIMTTHYWPFCDELEEELHGGWLPMTSQAMSIWPMSITSEYVCRRFKAHNVRPQAIAAAVDAAYGADIAQASKDVRAKAEEWSWAKLGEVYVSLFEDLVAARPIPETFAI